MWLIMLRVLHFSGIGWLTAMLPIGTHMLFLCLNPSVSLKVILLDP